MPEALIAEVDKLKETVGRFIEVFKQVDSELKRLEALFAANNAQIQYLESQHAKDRSKNALLAREP